MKFGSQEGKDESFFFMHHRKDEQENMKKEKFCTDSHRVGVMVVNKLNCTLTLNFFLIGET